MMESSPNELTERIIGSAMAVSSGLGCGFLEKVYERAMLIEMRHRNLDAVAQHPMQILYRGEAVGDYFSDLLVSGRVIVELKALPALTDLHTAQAINYLKATGLQHALLLNFGKPRLEIKRLVNQASDG